MSRIKNAFDHGKAFISFLTAGDPSADKTVEYILEMEKNGADLIEIGIPFSDPIAEGTVIQEANIRALNGGMTTDRVFEIAERVREKTQVPLVFLTYINPVFHYGYESFFKKCADCGVDGIIIPDLPFEEKPEVDGTAKKYGVDLISLIAPTSGERIKEIAAQASGFIYLVSSMGVTGMRNEIKTDLEEMVSVIKTVTDIPVAVGFGIHSPEQAHKISRFADGVIVGSAIVKLIAEHGENAGNAVADYVSGMKNALRS